MTINADSYRIISTYSSIGRVPGVKMRESYLSFLFSLILPKKSLATQKGRINSPLMCSASGVDKGSRTLTSRVPGVRATATLYPPYQKVLVPLYRAYYNPGKGIINNTSISEYSQGWEFIDSESSKRVYKRGSSGNSLQEELY